MDDFKNWFVMANKDLESALLLIKEKRFEQGAFFLQQSTEKSLKSLIIKERKKLIKTHDLILLARETNAPAKILENCKILTSLYQATRYPDIPALKEIEEEIINLIELTQEVVKWVNMELKK